MTVIRRHPFNAGLLGLLFPGLGFMYGGNIRLAIYYNLTFIFLTFCLGYYFVKVYPVGIILNFALIIVWYFGSFFAAFIYVWMNREVARRSYNRVIYYILFMLCILAIQYTFTKYRSELLGYDINRISGYVGSTLLAGDMVVTDTKTSDINIGDVLIYQGIKGQSVAKVIAKQNNGVLLDNRFDYQTIIPMNRIHGKPAYIWFSWNSMERKVRWERMPRFLHKNHWQQVKSSRD